MEKEVEVYISQFPETVQQKLKAIRQVIQKATPNSSECLQYGIPTFKLHGKAVVHYGAFKEHIGFYATPSGQDAFHEKLSKYKQGKGSVQFPLDQPLPFQLISEITEFRVKSLEGE